jgi:hypothetical protein
LTPECAYCGREIDPEKPGHFRYVQGWEEQRTQGGGHGLTSRVELGKYACGMCIRHIRAGRSPAQGSLLDDVS